MFAYQSGLGRVQDTKNETLLAIFPSPRGSSGQGRGGSGDAGGAHNLRVKLPVREGAQDGEARRQGEEQALLVALRPRPHGSSVNLSWRNAPLGDVEFV